MPQTGCSATLLLVLQKAFEEDASTDEAGNEADDEHETESDGALGDEQDEEVDSVYLDRLAKEAAKIKVSQCEHHQADLVQHVWQTNHACHWSFQQPLATIRVCLGHQDQSTT